MKKKAQVHSEDPERGRTWVNNLFSGDVTSHKGDAL